MKNFKTNILNREKFLANTKFFAILGLSILAPLFNIQLFTGPLVNALLFIATILIGPYSAIIIGILPSAFALSVGLLPIVMAPMIPFIVISNAILVLIFHHFQKKNYWLGIFTASILKYIFLFIVSQSLVSLLIRNTPAARVATIMMNWPQLITALIGGAIAYLFLRFIKKI